MTESKEIKVSIDPTPMEERIKSQFEQQLKEKDDLIKSLLARDKQEFVESIEPKKPTEYGDTARLETAYEPKIEVDGSYIEPSWVKGSTAQEVISKIEHLSHVADNKADFQHIKSKLTRKMLHSDKPLDIIFQGSSKEFIKSEIPISEFDSDSLKSKKTSYNERLRQNRVNWLNKQAF